MSTRTGAPTAARTTRATATGRASSPRTASDARAQDETSTAARRVIGESTETATALSPRREIDKRARDEAEAALARAVVRNRDAGKEPPRYGLHTERDETRDRVSIGIAIHGVGACVIEVQTEHYDGQKLLAMLPGSA